MFSPKTPIVPAVGSTTANALATTTTSVNVSNAAAPTDGQVFVADGAGGGSWQTPATNCFDVQRDYGGLFDGVQLHDGSITASSTTFSSPTAAFTSADVGKYMMVHGAGVSGAALITTISARLSATSVTLAAAASTTVTNGASTSAAQLDAYYASDDTTAWQNAINAALTASQTIGSSKPAIITFPNGISGIAGALQDVTCSNSQLYFPTSYGYLKMITIKFQGYQAPSPVINSNGGGGYTTPAYGTVLLGLLNTGAGGALFRCKTPHSYYGIHLATVSFENLTVRMPPNPVLSGLDLYYAAAMNMGNVVVDAGQQDSHQVKEPTTTTSYGIRTPLNGNGARNHFYGNVHVIGFYTGYLILENTTGDFNAWCCKYPIEFPFSYHASLLGHVLWTNCPHGIKITGTCFFEILQLDIEHEDTGHVPSLPAWLAWVDDITDASNYGRGKITWHTCVGALAVQTPGAFTKVGGTGIRCECLDTGVVT